MAATEAEPHTDRPKATAEPVVADPPQPRPDREPGGLGWLLLLAPLLCCGGPLLVAAAGALGALAWGALGGVVALAAAIGLTLARRRSRRCLEPAIGRRADSRTGHPKGGGAVAR